MKQKGLIMEYQAFKILTAPSTEPVLKADVKGQLRIVDFTDDDDMIDVLILASREAVEKYLGRALITQTLQIFFDCFPGTIEIPYSPLQSVTHVKYYDADGDQQTLSSSVYQADLVSVPGRIETAYGETWPSTRSGKLNTVEVQYAAGYGDAAADVPQPIKQTIISMAVDLYEHPESNIELRITNNPVLNRLNSYKIPVVY